MEHNEIIETVYDLNCQIADAIEREYSEYYLFHLSITTDGFSTIVEYLGFTIWSSDDDERQEIEEDVYEPLEVFLKRKINEIYNAYSIMVKSLN